MKSHLLCYISQFDPGGEEDADRLKQLFAITQHLMVLKAAQADVAEEEAAEEAKNTAKRGRKLPALNIHFVYIKMIKHKSLKLSS